MTKKTKQKIINALKFLWTFSIILFIFLYILKNHEAFLNAFQTFILFDITLSILFLFLGKIFLTLNFQLACQYEQTKIPFWRAFYIYNFSQLGKYMPGNIWHYVGKFGMLKKDGLDKKKTGQIILIETILIILGSSIMGLLLIFLTKHNLIFSILNIKTVQIGLIIGIIIFFTILFVLKNFFYNKVKEKLLRWLNLTSLHPKAIFIQITIWLSLGTSFFFLGRAFNSYLNGFYTIGFYAIAYIIGFLFPLSPAGIGIRESILFLSLIEIMTKDEIVSIASFHRLLYFLVEIALILIFYSYRLLKKI